MTITLEKAESKDADVLHALQVKSFSPTLKKYNDEQINPACEPLEKTLSRINDSSKGFYKILKDNVLAGEIAIKRTSSISWAFLLIQIIKIKKSPRRL